MSITSIYQIYEFGLTFLSVVSNLLIQGLSDLELYSQTLPLCGQLKTAPVWAIKAAPVQLIGYEIEKTWPLKITFFNNLFAKILLNLIFAHVGEIPVSKPR